MGAIIFWAFLLLVWIIFIIFTIIDDDSSFGNFIFSLFMLLLTATMFSYSINKQKTKKIFYGLRCGREYVGSPKDNPFKKDTIKVLNYMEENNKLWVEYQTSDGEVHVSQIGDIINYFK